MKYIYAIYKPIGMTSFDVIHSLRKITNIKKIGHAGTLDPEAEGVLIVGFTREGTKQLRYFENTKKQYLAQIRLGYKSTTFDKEGKLKKINTDKKPKISEIKNVLKKFIGKIDQMPPIYSAIKIKGIPAYKYARKGLDIKLKKRKVNIDKILVINYKWPILKIKIDCQKGVYIRSLANDIGKMLGTGAYLKSLTRTASGNFTIEKSLSLENFKKLFSSGKIKFLIK